MKVCKINGCESTRRIIRGWCNKHYLRWLTHGDPLYTNPNYTERGTYTTCTIAGCDRKHTVKGLCRNHHNIKQYHAQGGIKHIRRIKQQLISRYGNTCQTCGSNDRLEVDCIYPKDRGGEYKLDNCQLLCKSCNSRKRNGFNLFALAGVTL